MAWTTIRELSKKYNHFIFDQDRVLWYGMQHVGIAFRNIEWLQSQGKNVYFVTNNSAYTRKSLAAKMVSDNFKY